jgi:hypothetical protein
LKQKPQQTGASAAGVKRHWPATIRRSRDFPRIAGGGGIGVKGRSKTAERLARGRPRP